VNCLGHDNPHVRRIAATALGKIDHGGGREALARLAEDPGQPVMVRRAALRALQRRGALDARPLLEKLRYRPGPHQEAAVSRPLSGLATQGKL
jgi:HEAT repeat protein